MHTEEIRARRAALYFRSLLISPLETACSADRLLDLADAYTGYQRIVLPDGDPLLGGGFALLDRDFKTIWLNKGRPRLTQLLDAAHEYGHLFMHDLLDSDEVLQESVVGYSSAQRDEIDAHQFAVELLLPLSEAKSRFEKGESASEIAAQTHVPRRVAIHQITLAYAQQEPPEPFRPAELVDLDKWQQDALAANGSSLIVGDAGTGKSTILIYRCKNLITGSNEHPSKILVICDSPTSSELLRTNLNRIGGMTSFVPVTTPFQLARDLLVRFDEAANLSGRVEGSPINFPVMALDLLRLRPEIYGILRSRYRHVLVDNLDRLNGEARTFVEQVVAGVGTPMWATARRPLYLSLQTQPRQFRLANQYRYSSKLNALHRSAVDQKVKFPISRRKPDARCQLGSAKVAFARSRNAAADHVRDYIKQRLQEGYCASDIALLYDPYTGSGRLWKDISLNDICCGSNRGIRSKHVGELFGILHLVLGVWSRDAVLSVARTDRYHIPLTDFLEEQKDWRVYAEGKATENSSWRMLIQDIQICSKAQSALDILEVYIYEIKRAWPQRSEDSAVVTEFLNHIRHMTHKSMFDLLRDLGDRRVSIMRSDVDGSMSSVNLPSVIPYNAGLVRTWPVVIIAEPTFDDISGLFSTPSGTLDTRQNMALRAVYSAEDHLLVCHVSIHAGRDLKMVRSQAAHSDSIDIVDWSEPLQREATTPLTSYKSVSNDAVVTGDIFQQCPRQAYYEYIFRRKVAIDAAGYPASPVDDALCLTCQFEKLCPADL